MLTMAAARTITIPRPRIGISPSSTLELQEWNHSRRKLELRVKCLAFKGKRADGLVLPGGPCWGLTHTVRALALIRAFARQPSLGAERL